MGKNNRERKQKERLAKRSILFNIILVPFIPFVMAIGVSFYFFYTTLEERSVSSLKRVVEDHRGMIESFLTERRSDLEFITNTYGFHQLNSPEAMNGILGNLQKQSGAFVDLGLFNSEGVHIRYTGSYSLTGKDYKDTFWFKKVNEKGSYISDIFLGYRNVPHFVIAVRQGSLNEHWMIRATIDTQFFDTLVSRVRIGKTGEAYILNKNGIAQTKRRSGGIAVNDQDPEFTDFPKSENGVITFIKSDAGGNSYLYATAPLKESEWILVVRQEKKEVYRSVYSAFYISLVIMIIGGAIIVMMAMYMTERILKIIKKLDMDKETLGHQLIRATQLAEIGEMAAGFAHEINNPLQIIKGEHSLIMSVFNDLPEEVTTGGNSESFSEIRDCLNQIQLQVGRCSEITHAILKFGRKNEIRYQPLSPGETIPEIISMVEKKAGVHGISITRDISEDSFKFMGDPSQFQQVMLNLFNNAMDAIIERHGASGGKLRVESAVRNEKTIEIRICDNGSGIAAENIDKLFSPFFTTKPVGKGTGLGLSVCYGIIKNFGGTMDVESSQGVGTTFVIRLPAIK